MRVIKLTFPTMVMRYITKKTRNRGTFHSGWGMSPVRTNSVKTVAFSFSMSSLDGSEMKGSECTRAFARAYKMKTGDVDLKLMQASIRRSFKFYLSFIINYLD